MSRKEILSSETHQQLRNTTLIFAAKLKLAASFELECREDR